MKEKKGSGTGMGTLMPTMPTSISFWNLRAAAPACNHASQQKESMLVTAVWQHVKHEHMLRQQPASAGSKAMEHAVGHSCANPT